MRVPEGYTQQQVLDAIDKCADLLAPQFPFGIWKVDDIRQECYVYSIELLSKNTFDPARPLENYLYRHLKRRLINLRRNKLKRNDPPCLECHRGELCCDGFVCRKYQAWVDRNNAKSSLMRPMEIQEGERLIDSLAFAAASSREMLRILDEELTVEERGLWRKLLDGAPLPKPKRVELEQTIRKILLWPRENADE